MRNRFVKGSAVFWIILGFVVFSVVIDLQVYPTIQFPHFPVTGDDPKTIVSVDIYAQDGRKIPLSYMIQPYDHRFYVFFKKALLNERTSAKATALLNRIWKKKGGKGELRIRVSKRTYHFAE